MLLHITSFEILRFENKNSCHFPLVQSRKLTLHTKLDSISYQRFIYFEIDILSVKIVMLNYVKKTYRRIEEKGRHDIPMCVM